MASFLEKMRAPGLQSGKNPFSPTQQDPFTMLDDFRRRIPEPNLQQIGQGVAQQQPQPQPQQTRMSFAGGISPFQEAQLGLRERELQTREKSAESLAAQREAQTKAIPERLAQGERSLDIRTMDAETRKRLADLKDLPESERQRLLQEGRISLAELNAANQYSLQELRGKQSIELEKKRQTGRELSEDRRNKNARELAKLRGGAAQSPTQNKVDMQRKAAEIINKNPTWAEYITFDAQGFPIVSSDTPEDIYNMIYDSLYAKTPRDTELPASGMPANMPPIPPMSSRSGAPAQGNSDARAAELIKKYGGG